MKAKTLWILAVLVVSCVALLSVRLLAISFEEKSQLEDYGISTLKGLKAIKPVVIIMAPDKKANLASLTESDLQTQVELALRKTGVKVSLKKNSQQDLSVALLRVSVLLNDVVISSGAQLYSFVANVELTQLVQLTRDSEIYTAARTWPMYDFELPIIAGEAKIEQAIKDEVTRQVNEFCNDYLAANPREQQKSEHM